MKIGIIGPEGAGKTTVFSCLTGTVAGASHGKGDSLGVVRVPDPRLAVLTEMYQPRKTTPAEITFQDLGAGMSGSQRLSALTGSLADADALAVVVGGFLGDDPAARLESFLLDLVLCDLSIVENRLERIAHDLQRGKKESQAHEPLMKRLQEALGTGSRVADVALNPEEEKTLAGYQFVTRKPTLVVANVHERDLGNGVAAAITSAGQCHGLAAIELCAPLELEISLLPPEERGAFLVDYGMPASATDRFVRAAYELSELISFFTVGPDEVRAWSVPRGTLAPRAAGKIHSDIQKGFIRAEVVAYDDLIAAGSHQECRTRGQVRLEGKTYEMHDGDIVDFRFSI